VGKAVGEVVAAFRAKRPVVDVALVPFVGRRRPGVVVDVELRLADALKLLAGGIGKSLFENFTATLKIELARNT
jgi:hypothetical protein